MRISDNYRYSATFLVADILDEETNRVHRKPVATTFFIKVPVTDKEHLTIYAVTARHVISRARGKTLFIRFNTKDNSFIDYPTSPDDWIEHDSTDIAIIPILSDSSYELSYRSINEMITDDFLPKNT